MPSTPKHFGRNALDNSALRVAWFLGLSGERFRENVLFLTRVSLLILVCCCLQITQFLESRGFLDYLERGIDSDGNNNNLLDKLQDTIGRGQNPISILPTAVAETEITTISDPYVGILGSGAKHTYDRFPSNISLIPNCTIPNILTSSPSVQVGKDSLSPMERAAGNERMVLDIKVKLQVPFRILMSYLALRVPWFLGLSGVRYSDGNNNNLLDKLQDTIGRGQNPISILPPAVAETEITTISDPYVGILGQKKKKRRGKKFLQ
ncbi:hypothetical protein OIU77_011161 [Salix suchowensis]|uniref:Uncharacterized protein n=1 Tax=Salix suchowensis TaxID=1278906 RepID=A0ABQ9AAU1_9ROSI|nr:hypothetical protein OIU77_011161 [Salix suchowensis]